MINCQCEVVAVKYHFWTLLIDLLIVSKTLFKSFCLVPKLTTPLHLLIFLLLTQHEIHFQLSIHETEYPDGFEASISTPIFHWRIKKHISCFLI